MTPGAKVLTESLFSPYRLPGNAARYDLSELQSLRYDGSNRIQLIGDLSGNSAVNAYCCNAGSINSRATASLTGQNLGTSDWTLSFFVQYGSTTGIFNGFAQISPSATSGEGQGRSLNVNFSSADVFRVYLYGATTSDSNLASISGVHATYANMVLHVCITQASGVLKIYLNGIDTAYAGSTSGTPPGWDGGITSAFLGVGYNTASNVVNGVIYNDALYNRALSQAEVTELRAANGAPAAGDRWGSMTGPVAGCICYHDFATAAKLATTVSDQSSNALSLSITSSGDTGARICGGRDDLQMTQAKQPILGYAGGYPIATFDGSNDYMKSAPFALSQPTTVYIVAAQETWSSGEYLIDGNATNSGAIIQTTSTPQLNLNAGSSAPANTGLAVGTRGLIRAVFNGANSSLAINLATEAIGNAGAGNMGGFTVGARGAGDSAFSNIAFSEILIRSGADSVAMQLKIAAYLIRKWGIQT